MEVKKAIEIIEKFGIDYRGYPTLEKAVNVVLEYTKAQLFISQCGIEVAIDIINELPPAQPEPKTGI